MPKKDKFSFAVYTDRNGVSTYDYTFGCAFALRDFDKDKILQRPYFRMCNLSPTTTDEEFLSRYNETSEAYISNNVSVRAGISVNAFVVDVDEFDTRCQELKRLIDNLRGYFSRIEHHTDKLKSFSAVLADKIASSDESNKKWRNQYRRAKELVDEYDKVLHAITHLVKKAKETYKASDAKIQLEYRKRFANRLRLARLGKNYPQYYIANELGLTVASYQHYEKGRREPSITNIFRLAKILGVTPNWLLGYE